jgi:hypothetical protein
MLATPNHEDVNTLKVKRHFQFNDKTNIPHRAKDYGIGLKMFEAKAGLFILSLKYWSDLRAFECQSVAKPAH